MLLSNQVTNRFQSLELKRLGAPQLSIFGWMLDEHKLVHAMEGESFIQDVIYCGDSEIAWEGNNLCAAFTVTELAAFITSSSKTAERFAECIRQHQLGGCSVKDFLQPKPVADFLIQEITLKQFKF